MYTVSASEGHSYLLIFHKYLQTNSNVSAEAYSRDVQINNSGNNLYDSLFYTYEYSTIKNLNKLSIIPDIDINFKFLQILPSDYPTVLAWIVLILVFVIVSIIVFRILNQQSSQRKKYLEAKIKKRTRELVRKQKEIESEKERSDALLRNILPAKIASELKLNGKVKVQYYDLASVLFIDFKDFSKYSQFLSPMVLISELNKNFCEFDDITEKHRLEKIKTIGDAYMCAGGIPEPNLTNPFDAILAAFEILNYLNKAEDDQWLCNVRIGIHTGEILAGVIGKNKFAYDIWGEAVNTASRMESSGEAGKINISGETQALVADFFDCEYRGKLEAKHRNAFDMYFVNRIKKPYSKDENGTLPNELFWKKVYCHLNKVAI